jgi:hypothetical protein
MTYKRLLIREGDTLLPTGGEVKPRPQQYPTIYHGKLACYEGDPVYCYACKSWGKTKCIPPYRPHTDPEGRQANLDGDLCICKCPTPPRLKALAEIISMNFEEHEIAKMTGSESWLHHAGIIKKTDFHDEQFIFNDANGNPMANMNYIVRIKSTGAILQGVTDSNGATQRIKTASGGAADVEIIWGSNA